MSKKKSKKYADIHTFLSDFGTSEQCYRCLYDLKWSDGYSCRSYGHDTAAKGRFALCEHNYRFNNRNYTEDGFLRCLKNMVKMPPLPRQKAGRGAFALIRFDKLFCTLLNLCLNSSTFLKTL